MVKNYMEDVVDHLLPSILDNFPEACRCSQCIEDVKALALNNLQPLYAVTEKGNVYVKVNELIVQFRTDAITQIVNAIETVSRNPRHEKL
jgi:competence protein ComFB